MSRIHLTLLVLLNAGFGWSQPELKNLLRAGDEQFAKGDYYSAMNYYEQAKQIDSSTVEILWKCAETYRLYKDYRKAEQAYAKVYQKEEGFIYPLSLLYRGLMEKQNGKYEAAIQTFKTAKKLYRSDKNAYAYLKAKDEVASCVWAKNQQYVADVLAVEVPEGVNTKDAEFSHAFKDGFLYFSSLKADSMASKEEVYDTSYYLQIYRTDWTKGATELLSDLTTPEMHLGNGSFSLDKKRFYFSQCANGVNGYQCKIMVAAYENDSWTYIDELGEIINLPDGSHTMPRIGELDGQETLFFSSKRQGNEGGYDLYYAKILNGDRYSPPKPIAPLNTIENELSPYFDSENQTLYFSSCWGDAYGGYDIFSSKFVDNQFQKAENIGKPFNSPANDLYFFRSDSLYFLSSNRIGVEYSKNPTCCNDIFAFKIKPEPIIPTPPEETLEEMNRRLPITLYFHNDEPNPRTTDTTTNINYINSYEAYRAMLPKYQKEYSKGLSGSKSEEAKEDIESFFIEYVDQGVKDLNQFRDLLLKELEKGRKIQLTIKGFASPLAKSDYNVNLTKRRIASLVNYLNEYENGLFAPYLADTASNGGRLTFQQVPFGEYTANKLVSDNLNDQKNSVYSRAAGLERKIEIQSVTFEEDSIIDLPLEVDNPVQNLGEITADQPVTIEFTVRNDNDHDITFKPIRIPCDCSSGEIAKMTLQPGESTTVAFTFDPKGYEGMEFVKSIYVQTVDGKEETRLIITGQVTP